MRHKPTRLLLLVTCSLFLLVVVRALQPPKRAGDNVAKTCIPWERDALLAFKQGITNDTQNMLASWRPGHNCCRWRGVRCSNKSGHVIKLDLHDGSDSWYNDQGLVGQISPSLLSLEQLEYLDLSRNYNLEAPNNGVPEFLGSMKNLKHLDICHMNFSSRLLPFLGNLSHLEYLDFSWNYNLEAPNNGVPEFLGSMKNLRHLGLSGMPFSGRLPSFLGNLSNLEYLDISESSLFGSVPPQLGNLSNLEYLDISESSLSGSVPPQLGNLSNLYYLGLGSRQNLYSIDISWLSHLHLLEYLDMSSVNLSATIDWPHVLNTVPSLQIVSLSDCLLSSANQSIAHLNLTILYQLDLSFNNFDHSVSSCWFWNLTSIKILHLDETYLYGEFPMALGRMTSLQTLTFGENHNTATMQVDLKDLCALECLSLDGSLSSGNITEFLEKLPQCPSNKLWLLSLRNNNMTGLLPDRLMHLTTFALDLSHNNLTGAIPQGLGNCTSLEMLDLSNNHLTGAIPPGIGNRTSLLELDLSNNHLTGAIPPGIGNRTSLYMLDLSNNHLTGAIPSEIRNYTCLEYLDLSNNHLIGSIHPVTENNFHSLYQLDLSNNNLSGVVPSGIRNFTILETIILHSNQLTGQIPTLPRSLVMLDISKNFLLGPLPTDFGAPNIRVLTLFSNHISGHITRSICKLQSMQVLDLSTNFLEGELPMCFRMPNMVFLLLNNNRFSGKLPPVFRSCSSLAFVDLAWNNFYGILPLWIGALMNLQFLQLSHNMFYGDIPVSITNLRRLRHLNLANNNISGDIPLILSNLTAMTKNHWTKRGVNMSRFYRKRVGEFKEIIPVVMKQQELKYGAEIFEVVAIDLSHNHLTGRIPNQITSLDRLMNLNLSWNHLTGNIPERIGDMKFVASLDLSRNNLSGEIPRSLSDLTYLGCMDLSFNNLTGTIPSGRQLDTLFAGNPSIYDGNNGLCGPPLLRNCSGNNSPENGNQQTGERDHNPLFFYLGLVSGYIAGLWVVFCALLFKKVWRIAYFRLCEMVYDKVYVYVIVTWGRLATRTSAD